MRDARPPRGTGGQASVELVAALPLLIVIGLVVFQLLAVGYTAVLAGTAAEAGALALVAGADPKAGVQEALPGWSRARARVLVHRERVEVKLRPPSLVQAIARRLEITAGASLGEAR